MILVVGLSTRILVQSIHDTQNVFALDVFGDRDLREKVCGWKNIGNSRYKIEDQKFLKVFKEVVREFSPSAWIHTSGFEGKYNLITEAEKFLTHYGLSEENIKKVRSPASFFKALKKLNIKHPETIINKNGVPTSRGWLIKNFDTSGGLGIVKNNSSHFRTQGTYFQKEIKGKPLSVFFLVKQESIVVFGFCENLYEKKYGFPYFYQGLVGPIRLSVEVEINVLKIVKKVVDEFNLIGLNGLDFILTGNDVFVIELNPRPTAALEIFEKLMNKSLLNMHCNVFISEGKNKMYDRKIKFNRNITLNKKFFGTKIVNCDSNIMLSDIFLHQLESLSYCRDIPNIKNFKIGDPLCSIMVESSNITKVKSSLLRANSIVNGLIQKYIKT